MERKDFIKTSVIGGISFMIFPSFGKDRIPVKYRNGLEVATRLYDGTQCWSHPRAGIVPGAGDRDLPRVVMTMNSLDLAGSDVFRGMFGLETGDLGKRWSEPAELMPLAPRYELIDGVERPVAVSDFWPAWHESSGKLLGTGHTVVYTTDWKVTSPRPRNTSWSVYDPVSRQWSGWKKLVMPDSKKFYNSGAGCTQRYDRKNDILLPVSFKPVDKNSRVTVCRCSFDGNDLKYLEHGTELNLDDNTRGLGEPSLTRFNGEYFMTIRNDNRGFVAKSRDGLNFDPMVPWTFDDGSELGSYNTQQHWVTHSDALFLVYTRRGAGNDHVFRHRAPLFMAMVDPDKPCVIRETERILVPERGARLGNFGVTRISDHETWVTVAEWMQPHGVDKYGSDGSVFIARIHWNKRNRKV